MMLRSVFLKSLRDQLGSLMWWALGIIGYVALVLVFFPTMQDSSELVQQYMTVLPEAFRATIVGHITDIASPSGFLTSYYFALFMPIAVIVYAAVTGAAAIAGEERAGFLDMQLANPISRARYTLERAAHMVVGVAWLCLVIFLTILVGAGPVGMELDVTYLATVSTRLFLFGVAMGMLSLGLGAATGNPGLAGSVVAAYATLGYVVDIFAVYVTALQPLRMLSLWYYYGGNDPTITDLSPLWVGIPVLSAAVFLLVGIWAFERRDLAN